MRYIILMSLILSGCGGLDKSKWAGPQGELERSVVVKYDSLGECMRKTEGLLSYIDVGTAIPRSIYNYARGYNLALDARTRQGSALDNCRRGHRFLLRAFKVSKLGALRLDEATRDGFTDMLRDRCRQDLGMYIKN